jgi:hypothetical protein
MSTATEALMTEAIDESWRAGLQVIDSLPQGTCRSEAPAAAAALPQFRANSGTHKTAGVRQ